MILTVDLGTTVTKAAVWDEDGLVATGHSALATTHPSGGRAEQDPAGWWPAVVDACRAASTASGAGTASGASGLDGVQAVVFTGARQTIVAVAPTGRPLGKALLWSDRRAGAEAARLAAACGGEAEVRRRTGAVLDDGAVAAKLSWLGGHQPEVIDRSAWVLSPRDLMVRELTGVVATDTSLASASGLYDLDGKLVPELAGAAAGKLPEVVASDTVVGRALPGPARDLGVPCGVPVVIGAGDRACEVLGAGAASDRPMVAWGTTANVSVPVADIPDPVPDALVLTRGALAGWLLEGGLSAAGSLLAWLGGLTGIAVEDLARLATDSPPGARGVVALPWPGGARAPWWRAGAGAGFLRIGLEHGPEDLARALLEAVAYDVARCLDAFKVAGRQPRRLALGGSGATGPAWIEVLTGVTGLPAQRRKSGEAAMAGAALVGAAALGCRLDLDRLDPVTAEIAPPDELVGRYAELRPDADRVAAAAVALDEERR